MVQSLEINDHVKALLNDGMNVGVGPTPTPTFIPTPGKISRQS